MHMRMSRKRDGANISNVIAGHERGVRVIRKPYSYECTSLGVTADEFEFSRINGPLDLL